MSLRILLGGALAALLLVPAAAPADERQAALSAEQPEYKWTSESKTGAVVTTEVSSRVPACTAAFACDATLVRTDRYGNLQAEIAGKGAEGQPTLVDVDLHLYTSNADGAIGELIAEDTSADANESVLGEDLPAGWYLVYSDWYLGAGSIDGAVRLQEPSNPTDDPPAFVPAQPRLEPVAFNRKRAFPATGGEPFTWQAQGGGLSDAVSSGAPCTAATCDYSLFELGEAGLFTVSSKADGPTLIDGDILIYESNAEGGLGEQVGAATAFTPDETLTLELEPGFYLARYQFSGAGSYTGTASLAPLPPAEE